MYVSKAIALAATMALAVHADLDPQPAVESPVTAVPDENTMQMTDEGDILFTLPPMPTKTHGCTTTLWEVLPFVFGPTETVWTKTVTTTKSIDCGPCTAVVTSIFHDGPGPVVHFTTTITETQPSLTTAFACKTTTPTTTATHIP
ncbi:hypothetical protein E4U41_000003 [Claviceps citrina]|nr:hypothetical protein E4U41_000003 [Claviceps citrina]